MLELAKLVSLQVGELVLNVGSRVTIEGTGIEVIGSRRREGGPVKELDDAVLTRPERKKLAIAGL